MNFIVSILVVIILSLLLRIITHFSVLRRTGKEKLRSWSLLSAASRIVRALALVSFPSPPETVLHDTTCCCPSTTAWALTTCKRIFSLDNYREYYPLSHSFPLVKKLIDCCHDIPECSQCRYQSYRRTPDYILREFQFQPSHPRYWSRTSAIEPVLAIPTVGSFSRNKKEERQRW